MHFTSVSNRTNDRKLGRIKILDVLRLYQSNGIFFFSERILFKILSALPVTVYIGHFSDIAHC